MLRNQIHICFFELSANRKLRNEVQRWEELIRNTTCAGHNIKSDCAAIFE